jgi:hypothetical protein
VQVRDHERDRLRRLVAQEDMDLLRRRAPQELERAALDRRRQAADQLLGARGAERALEDVARVVDPALGDVVLGQDRLVGTLRDLAISSDSASTSPSPRWRKISLARSSPIATSRIAAFSMPFSES